MSEEPKPSPTTTTTTSTTSATAVAVAADGGTELSKNQLKKLAQKEEKKKNKKQQTQQQGKEDPAVAATTATAASSAAPTPTPTPPSTSPPSPPSSSSSSSTKPTFTLVIPPNPSDANMLDLVKVACAWRHASGGDGDVSSSSLQVEAGGDDGGSVVELHCHASSDEDDDGAVVVLRDGNAMVRAIVATSAAVEAAATSATSSAAASVVTPKSAAALTSSVHQSLVQDDWMEWERSLTRLVVAAKSSSSSSKDPAKLHKLIQVNLAELADSGLKSHAHVGDRFGPADIAIVATLGSLLNDSNKADDGTVPPSVLAYYTSHLQALQQAAKDADQWVRKARQPPSLLRDLHSVFRTALRQLYPELLLPKGSAAAVIPAYFISVTKSGGQDYQASLAMPVTAALKASAGAGASNVPTAHQVAAQLIEVVQSSPIIEKCQVVGPGFVCFNVTKSYLNDWMEAALRKPTLDVPNLEGQNVVVDFSSPNIAKEMHVGHLRSTIIGESVCRILESCGANVHRVNHVGDWGTQFGMLIAHLQEMTSASASSTTTGSGGGDGEQPNISDLTVFYKSAKERFDQDPVFKATSQQNVVKLQAGDPECRKIWQTLCDISRREFEKVYKRLDVTLEEFGESFYNDKIPPVLDEFEAAGLLELDQSAKVVRIAGHPVPLMLRKSDGGFGYDSTDMAALKYRLFDLKADRVIVITDFSQESHFQMVYKAGEMIGWVKDGKQRLQHIGFGTVMGEDGKRFKTRSGDTVRLVDLLDEAVSRMEAQLRDRIANNKANIALEEVHEVAEAIGYGALKYFDLRRNPKSNYKFSYDEMLDTKGDTAVYLLYARVRLESIMAKAAKEHRVNVQDLLDAKESIVLEHESERKLALALAKFADVMEETLDDLFPCHICEYVYRVTNAATDFVTQCKVLGSPEMKSRLLLCHFTASAIHQCFDLLGIRHVKRI
jgi:arginyl-tRNA synthetase